MLSISESHALTGVLWKLWWFQDQEMAGELDGSESRSSYTCNSGCHLLLFSIFQPTGNELMVLQVFWMDVI